MPPKMEISDLYNMCATFLNGQSPREYKRELRAHQLYAYIYLFQTAILIRFL